MTRALTGVAQWIECQPVNRKVADLIPSQGTCLGCGPGPQLGAYERQPHIDMSPLSPSRPLSLKINKILTKNQTDVIVKKRKKYVELYIIYNFNVNPLYVSFSLLFSFLDSTGIFLRWNRSSKFVDEAYEEMVNIIEYNKKLQAKVNILRRQLAELETEDGTQESP